MFLGTMYMSFLPCIWKKCSFNIFYWICFFFQGEKIPLKLVEKWTLCIDVSCYTNLWKAVITYVICNIVTNNVLQRKLNISGRTSNNVAYGMALIEGLGTAREYGSNWILVFTNFEFVCNHMKDVYQVKKERLKQLHGK